MSDYGVVPSHIQEYLHEVIGNAPSDVADDFAALLDLYSRKYDFTNCDLIPLLFSRIMLVVHNTPRTQKTHTSELCV